MSTTIHSIFQRRQHARWVDVPTLYMEDQDYYLFRWLAAVPVSGDFEPIAPRRGLPDDFDMDDGWHPVPTVECLPAWRRRDRSQATTKRSGHRLFMGERGFSWLHASEILITAAPVPRFSFEVFIDDFRQWDGVSLPRDWLDRFRSDHRQKRLLLGETVSTPESVTEKTEFVVMERDCDFAPFFRYFVEEAERLVNAHGEVRFVFGFS